MPNELHVTLDTTTGLLDVDQSNNGNHFGQSPNPQTIVWKLTGNAAGGTFNSPTDPSNPGFTWSNTPPNGIFGSATLVDGSHEMTMTDLNNGPSSVGIWIYQLQANINGINYKSGLTQLRAVPSDPCIKNN